MNEPVHIPEDSFIGAHGVSKGLPDVWIVNTALEDLQPKGAFPWHLSIIVECKDLADARLPTKEENAVLAALGDVFDENLTRDTNAVRLARVTWNGTRQFVYRVHNADVANAYLQAVIQQRSSPREFEFRMESDPEWLLAQPALSLTHRSPDEA